MATRKPLVLVNGEMQQLQPGDDISVPITGSIEISLTNDEAGAVVIGTPVYSDAAAGFKKAKADAAGTSKVIGLVNKSPSIANGVAGPVATEGIVTLTTVQWDAVTGGSGGLIFGTPYFLDPATAGMLTTTAPTTTGQYVVQVGIALSTVDMKLSVERRILL